MHAGGNWKGEQSPPHVVTSCVSKYEWINWHTFYTYQSLHFGVFCQISLITFKGTEDAGRILSNDGSCPICDQVLSRRY